MTIGKYLIALSISFLLIGTAFAEKGMMEEGMMSPGMMKEMSEMMEKCSDMMRQMSDMMKGMQRMMEGGMMEGMMPPEAEGEVVPQKEVRLTEESLTKVDSQGAVTIALTYLNPLGKAKEGEIAFKVSMDTHSVNLDQYRIEALIILRDGRGSEYSPIAWEGSGGGHHLSGILRFGSADPSGNPIIRPETKYIEVIVKDVAGISERSFKWEL